MSLQDSKAEVVLYAMTKSFEAQRESCLMMNRDNKSAS